MEGLQFLPQGSLGCTSGVPGVNRVGRFGARVGHSVEFALAAAATNGKVDRTVLTDGHVGQRQRVSGNELFLFGSVG